MTSIDEPTLAEEVAVVIVRLVCDVDRPLTWRASPSTLFAGSPKAQACRVERHTAVVAIMFLEQTITKTCNRMQQLGLSPCDVLRHDGGRATACVVDTVRADIGTFSNTPPNVEWKAVLEAALSLVAELQSAKRSRKRFWGNCSRS
jgi:hypothetical protein